MNKTLLIWISFLIAFLIAGYVTWGSANVSFHGEKTQATCIGIEITEENTGNHGLRLRTAMEPATKSA